MYLSGFYCTCTHSIFLPDCPLEDAVDLAPVHDERGQVGRHHRVPAGRRPRQERAGVEHGAKITIFKVV